MNGPNDNTQKAGGLRSERSRAVASLIGQVRSARARGERADDQAIIASHSELMPELGLELEKLKRIEAAWAAARTPEVGNPQAPARPDDADARTTVAGLDRPAVEAPGYTVLREIGRGGQAVVFLAIKLNPGRRVALKVMRDGSLASGEALARFRREAEILAKLDHPNIVTILETGQTADGSQYLAMNYIGGCGLGEYMQRPQDKDDPSTLMRLFLRICEVVGAAHRARIVHRDLKPGNIRVDEHGEPHVLDFGLARSVWDRATVGETISVTGEFLGSLPWSSPEQAAGDSRNIDVRTDVYSLGVILYQMLTGGRFPYVVVGNIRDVLNNIVTSEPTPPSKVMAAAVARKSSDSRVVARTHPPAVNPEIERIVLKALAKRPEDRYQNAGELRRAIADYLLGKQAPAAKQPEVKPKVGRSRRVAGVIAVTVALLGAACFLWQKRSAILRARQDAQAEATNGEDNRLQSLASGRVLVAPVAHHTAASKARKIDLLKLVEPDKDLQRGTWNSDGGTVHFLPMAKKGSLVDFPYLPPDEYDYRIVFTVVSPTPDFIAQICSFGDQPFLLALAGRYNRDFQFETGHIEPSPTQAISLVPGKQYTSLVQVRKDKVSAFIDQTLIASFLPYKEMHVDGTWRLPHPGTLGLASWTCGIDLDAAEIVEVSGPGRYLRGESAVGTVVATTGPATPVPAIAVYTPASAGRVVNLMPLIDLEQDVVAGRGRWAKDRAGLTYDGKYGEGFYNAAVRAGYEPPAEYDFRLTFTPSGKEPHVHLLVSSGGRPAAVCFHAGAKEGCKVGWEDSNALSTRQTMEAGVPHRAVVQVRSGKITAYLDGALVGQCRTDTNYHPIRYFRSYVGDRAVGVFAEQGPCSFSSMEVVELNGPGRLARETTVGTPPPLAKAPPADKAHRTVDLMPLIQVPRDAVKGKWTRAGNELLVQGDSGKYAFAAVPYEPPEEYDYHVEFTRTGAWDDVFMLMSSQQEGVAYKMGFYSNTGCGFQGIDTAGIGKSAVTGGDSISVDAAGMLLNDRRYSAIVHVRKGYIAASIDGKLISEHRTEGTPMSLPPAWGFPPGVLGVGAWEAPVTFHKIEISEITGEGKPSAAAPVATTGPATPAGIGDLRTRQRGAGG